MSKPTPRQLACAVTGGIAFGACGLLAAHQFGLTDQVLPRLVGHRR